MKRFGALLIGLALLSLGTMVMASATNGCSKGYQQYHVITNVQPSISMGCFQTGGSGSTPTTPPPAIGTLFTMDDVQTGCLTATIPFSVDANMQKLGFYATASDLYKGDDPLADDPYTIPLNLNKGVKIVPQHASPLGSLNNWASFNPTPNDQLICNFPNYSTNTINFESSQNGDFSQVIDVTFSWFQPDAELPVGQYSGIVRLTAVAIPQTETGQTQYR